jgi:hypothetical protein
LRKVGSAEGIIIATIIASHMSKKLVADANQLWPCIGIHIIDIVHPPGISIWEHIERQKYAVATAPAQNARTQIAMKPTGSLASWKSAELLRWFAISPLSVQAQSLDALFN